MAGLCQQLKTGGTVTDSMETQVLCQIVQINVEAGGK